MHRIPGLRFSIWDLAVFTAFAAAVFAVPIEVTQFLVAAACVVLLLVPLLLFITIFTARQRTQRKAIAERFMILLLVRGGCYALAMLVVGGTAVAMNWWS